MEDTESICVSDRSTALLLLAVSLSIPLVWLTLGWRWDHLVGSNDLSLLLIPAMRRLLSVQGDFASFLYDPAWSGGSRLRDILGALPLHRVLAAMPITPTTLLNLTVFFAQILYGYLATRTAHAITILCGRGREFPFVAQVAVAVMGAFAPIVGWRIGYGHVYILFGALALPTACSVLVLVRARQLSVTCAFVSSLALVHALPHVGQQPVIYGIVFGLPILLGFLFSFGPQWGTTKASIGSLALALGGTFLVSMPDLYRMIRHFEGTDSTRGLDHSVTYSYLVATGRDWLSSLPWGLRADWSGRAPFQLHETNYPVGPIILFVWLAPRRARAVLFGLAASVALVLAFSMNLRPVSTILLSLVPPLDAFRVPARAALPILMSVYPLFVAFLLAHSSLVTSRRDLFLLPVAALLLLVDNLAREATLWLVCLIATLGGRPAPSMDGLVPPGRFARSLARVTPSAPAMLLFLALGSLLGFKQRLLPFPSNAELLDRPSLAGQQVIRLFPQLASPLFRVAQASKGGSNNQAYRMGLSSIEGYNLLGARFTRLYCALLGVPYQSSVSQVTLDASQPYFAKVAALYNIVARFQHTAQGTSLIPVDSTGAPLWFSAQIETHPHVESLVAALDPGALGRKVLVAADDPAAQDLPRLSCSATGEIPYTTGPGPAIVRAALPSGRSGLCPLTVSMNYAEDFVVAGKANGTWQRLRTFPAYGALLGVLVPDDVREIEVQMVAATPLWMTGASALGVLLLGLFLLSAVAVERSTRARGSHLGPRH